MTNYNKLHLYWPGIALFFLSLIFGLCSYKDYGVSWDEPTQRGIGVVTWNYVFEGNQTLKTYEDRDLGTGFELPLIFLEKKLNLTTSRDIYLMRHLVTHLFFLLSVLCGYFLFIRLFKNPWIACLGFLMLAFHPRIYAHSYFNTKDIPFLSAFIIAFSIGQLAFQKNRMGWFFLLGITCGYATSIRAMGILLVPCFLAFFIIDVVGCRLQNRRVWPVVLNCLLFIAGFSTMLYTCWPILWTAPIHYFAEEFNTLSHIFWKGEVLFAGQVYNGEKLPLSYLPGWFCITVPELWLLAGLAGCGMLTFNFFRNTGKLLMDTNDRNFLLYLVCFFGPVIAVLVLKSVNYDDWRHLYFIYPSFVLLALYAISKVALGRLKPLVIALSVVQSGLVLFFMVRNHPYQQVYFNSLVSHQSEYLRKNYDLDYWGCAYKQGLDYILDHDHSDSVRVYRSSDPVINAIRLLPESRRKRVIPCNLDEKPAYFITNFRNHPSDYDYPETLFQVQALNSTIMRVYRMPENK